MPDITMCPGNDCPLKKACYRFNAHPNDFWQSFFSEPPYDKERQECEHFWLDGVTGKYDSNSIANDE